MTRHHEPSPPSVGLDRVADAVRHVDECLRRADEYTGRGVWIHRCSRAEIDAQVQHLATLVDEKRELPLLGMTVAVKDNIDVAGLPTTAACPAFAYTPQVSSTVVSRLTEAGAVVIGKTNLDQFATGLVGTRSPHGACENFYDRRYVSGGSSAGSAVAVAAGICDFSLGSDTAGSGRVPAGFNNLVGVKPSLGLLSSTGMVPACRSLDTMSIFARELTTARRVLTVAEAFDVTDIYSRSRSELPSSSHVDVSQGFRVGIPQPLEFFGNTEYRRLFDAATARFDAIGGTRAAIDYEPFQRTAELLYEGPWVAERLAAIHAFFERSADQLMPVTRTIIGSAAKLTAVDTFQGIYKLAALRRQTRVQWDGMDVLLLPTAGTIYTIDEVNADPIAKNRDLGYYTNFVNLLDLCALAIPAGFTTTGLPFGVTLVAAAGTEDRLFAIAERFIGQAS